jgi:hypothetical protein
MRRIVKWASVLALMIAPIAGCSESTDATGGTAGMGGTGGDGGGAAGIGGDGGTGGVADPTAGIWTGTGDGADGTFSICFNVNESGDALVRPFDSNNACMGYSINIVFDECESGFSTTEEVAIVDGSFRLFNDQGGLAGFWDITGTIDGAAATGAAELAAVPDGTCSGDWSASPSP